MTDQTPDRYVSSLGPDCAGKADRLIGMLSARMAGTESRWGMYFDRKGAEKRRMGADNLHFVGSQINTLRAVFEDCDDKAALDLLFDLERTCC